MKNVLIAIAGGHSDNKVEYFKQEEGGSNWSWEMISDFPLLPGSEYLSHYSTVTVTDNDNNDIAYVFGKSGQIRLKVKILKFNSTKGNQILLLCELSRNSKSERDLLIFK